MLRWLCEGGFMEVLFSLGLGGGAGNGCCF